jgi:hypothetical protein
MGIQATVTVEVASVEVNDEYRVELKQLRKVTDYSPEEAVLLAEELFAAAANAIEALKEDHQARAARQHRLVVDGLDVL